MRLKLGYLHCTLTKSDFGKENKNVKSLLLRLLICREIRSTRYFFLPLHPSNILRKFRKLNDDVYSRRVALSRRQINSCESLFVTAKVLLYFFSMHPSSSFVKRDFQVRKFIRNWPPLSFRVNSGLSAT